MRNVHDKIPDGEEPRLKLYDPDNEIFPIRLKYVDVMRQTQTSVNNVSEISSMIYGPKRRVSIFLRRFQILRTSLLEGYKSVNGRHAKIPQDHQTRQHLAGQKKVPNCKQHAATEEATRYRPRTEMTSR